MRCGHGLYTRVLRLSGGYISLIVSVWNNHEWSCPVRVVIEWGGVFLNWRFRGILALLVGPFLQLKVFGFIVNVHVQFGL